MNSQDFKHELFNSMGITNGLGAAYPSWVYIIVHDKCSTLLTEFGTALTTILPILFLFDSTHHFVRNACTKSGSLRFSQFSGGWLILSVYNLWVLTFPLEDCSEFGNFVITLFLCSVWWTLDCLSIVFSLAIVLSVFRRFTALITPLVSTNFSCSRSLMIKLKYCWTWTP